MSCMRLSLNKTTKDHRYRGGYLRVKVSELNKRHIIIYQLTAQCSNQIIRRYRSQACVLAGQLCGGPEYIGKVSLH